LIHQLLNWNNELCCVLESITDGIIMLDDFGKVIKINNAFEKMVKVPANHFLGSDIRNIQELGNVPDIVHKKILQKKRPVNVIEHINGQEMLVSGNYILDSECKLTKVVIILKDLNRLCEVILHLQANNESAAFSVPVSEAGLQKEMIAAGNAMKRVVNLALRVARVDSTVLITGETGVGKEVLARAIHKNSRRMAEAFIRLNCGAIPENLLESELFGYEAGAFTGAKREGKPGLVEMADGGTLFLDEVADLPMNLQVKLLRVLQEREIQRVGGVKVKKVDFRLIAATSKSLEEMVRRKLFRDDLFYRLNVVPVMVPPLRERKEDIVPLVALFLKKFNKKYGLTRRIPPEVIQNLLKYDWPGNVRELENTVERLVVLSDKNLILLENLMEIAPIAKSCGSSVLYLRNVLAQKEKHLILQAIQQCNTTREMANALGVSQSAVVKKMRKHGISKCRLE